MSKVALKDYPEIQYPPHRSLIERFIQFAYYRKESWLGNCKQRINALHPGILKGVQIFGEKTGKNKPGYEFRMNEILDVLEKHHPKAIAEMGTGRSSLLFAAWADKQGCDYCAFEQLDEWLELSSDVLKNVTENTGYLKKSDIEEISNFGGRYKKDIAPDTDFIYVDGPTIDSKDNVTTYTKKSCYTDAADFIRNGGRPKVIMFEGRTDSVDITLAEAKKAGLPFKFQPAYNWAVQRNDYVGALGLRYHSIIIFD